MDRILDYNKKMDELQKGNLLDVCPEFKDYASTYCNEVETVHYDFGKLGPCCTYRGNEMNFRKCKRLFNSSWLAELKKKMLNGERDDGCKTVGLKKIKAKIARHNKTD